MAIIFDPSVPIGVRRPWLAEERSLATRVRMVLETHPGTLPWRPEFGCDLQELVGYPATSQLLSQAKWRIESALRRWIPDADLDKVEVRVVPNSESGGITPHRTVPVAESALLTVGVQAALHVEVEMTGHDGPMALSTTIAP